MVESSTPPNSRVLANFWAESDASAISDVRPETAPTRPLVMEEATPATTPVMAAILPLKPDAAPLAEERPFEKAAPALEPSAPNCLLNAPEKPSMEGMMDTYAVPTLDMGSPRYPFVMPSLASISALAASALSRLRRPSATWPGVSSGLGLGVGCLRS